MNETNPYSPPQAEPSAKLLVPLQLRELDFSQLRKLYHRSCNVNAITFLIGTGLIVMVILTALPSTEFGLPMRLAFVGITVIYAIAVFGLFKRTSWGRIVGIMICFISLINLPVGTLIGIFGLYAFFGSPQLFGINRVTHKDLKAEFKLQKANRKKA